MNTHQSGHQLDLLHEEHVAVLDKLMLLTQAIRAPRTGRDSALPRYRALLLALLNDLDGLVEDHFRLEEQYLFPLLREEGKRDLADSLALEHVAIRHAALPVLDHVRHALAANPSDDEWKELARLTTTLVDMKQAHVRREVTEVVPVLQAVAARDRPQAARELPQAIF
jgi:DUF438 domain-containing protein